MLVVNLPTQGTGQQKTGRRRARAWDGNGARKFDRIALAAAHIVVDPLADVDPAHRAIV
jgi:hypothetical protein